MRWPWQDVPFRQSHFPQDPERYASVGRQIIWTATALIVVSGCVVAVALFYLRNEALLAGEKLTRSLAQVIAEQTSRTFQAADQRLQLAASRLQALEAEKRLTEDSGRAMLREQLKELPFARALWILDRQGRIVFDSDTGNIGTQLADREYFQIYQQSPATGFHISAPVRSRTTGTWLISASRPLRSASGELTGVIVAAVEPPYFDTLWRDIDLGAGGAIALFRSDGLLMMRSPIAEQAMGKFFSAQPLFTEHLPLGPQGTFTIASAVDARERIVSYRTLSPYSGMLVTVAPLYDDVLEPWRRFATLSSVIWLASAATVVLLSVLLYRQSRKRAGTDLRFRQLAQAMPQIVFITDGNGRLTFVSDQWCEVTGEPLEAALRGGWLDHVHPDDLQRTMDDMRHMLDTGQSRPNEHRLRCKDGSYRWQLVRATPNRDRAERIVSWYCTSTDVDELKRAEATLQVQTGLMRIAGHISRLGGWALELPDMRFIWSDEASHILGLPKGTAPTLESAIGLCAPQWREMATKVAQDCLNHGTPFDVELEMLTPAGRTVWVRSMGQAVRDDKDNITRMHGALQDITDRKLAAQALLESEQRHAALFDAAPVPMWVMDRQDNHHIAVNDTAIRLYGYSREEFVTMTPADLLPAAGQARLRQLMVAGLPMDTPEFWMHRQKDGTEFPVELIRRVIRYGGRDAVFAVAFDITLRVRAEQEVQAYLQTLQRVADAAQAITQHQALDTMMQEVAEQSRAIIGAHQSVISLLRDGKGTQAIMARSLSDKYGGQPHWTDSPEGTGIHAMVCETRRAVRLTQAELQADPRWCGINTSAGQHQALRGWLAVPLTGRDGDNIGLLHLSDKFEGEFTQQDEYVATELAQLASIAIDNVNLLSQVKDLNSGLEEKIIQRSGELSRQEALFRTLAEQAPQPIWTVDPAGAATFFSRAWYELVGGAPPDWHGHGWVGLVHPDDVAAATQNWRVPSAEPTLFTGTRRLRARNGAYHTMSYRASPVRNERGEVIFWVGIDADITEIKAIETALRLSNAELEAFSYSVSHDLRSPLTTVDGFSRLLAKELHGNQGKKLQHYLTRIQSGVGQMGQLIEGLLSLAHVARLELRHEPVDLSAIASEILERLQAGERTRQAACSIEPGLLVYGDGRLLRSVMENLLGNAWKFSSRRAQTTIAVGRSTAQGAFFVCDNGAGFDMAYADKLFGTFQRLHNVSEYAGTGVGLATVARVIARHRGRIWAESAPDKGATFFFTLPGEEL